MLKRLMIVLIIGMIGVSSIQIQADDPLPIYFDAVWHPTDNIVALTNYQFVALYDEQLNELLRLTIPPESPDAFSIHITEIAWSPDGTKLAAAVSRAEGESGLSRVIVWDITNDPPELVFNVDGLKYPLAWSPDNSYLAAVSAYDSALLILGDVTDLEAPFRKYYAKTNIMYLDWHPTNLHELAIGSKGAEIVDPLPEITAITEMTGENVYIGLMYSPDGDYYIIIEGTNLEIWRTDWQSSDPSTIFSYYFGESPLSTDWLTDGIAISYFDRSVRKFDVFKGGESRIIPVEDTTFGSIGWKTDGTRFVTISREAGIRVVDGNTGETLAGLDLEGRQIDLNTE